MQRGNQRETSKIGSQEAGKYVGDLFSKYLFDLEHSNEKAKDFEYQSGSTKHGILEGGKKDGAFNYSELPKNLVGSSLPQKDLMPCAHQRNISNYGDPKARTTKVDILIKDLIDLRDSNESGDVLFSDLVWSRYERGSRKHGNSKAGTNEGTPNLIDMDPLKDLKSKAGINEGDFYINDFIDLRDSEDRDDLLFKDLVWSNYLKDNSMHGDDKYGGNEGEHCLSCIEPMKDLMQSDEKRDGIIHGNPNVERIEGGLLINNLIQSRQEKNSIWNDIPEARSIEEHPPLICTEPAVSFQNCYDQVEEEGSVNYKSTQKPDYSEVDTRISRYNEEMDNFLSWEHSTIYISSSSIEEYDLRFASDEDVEEELGIVPKPNYLQASTLTENENNRDVEDDECVILNSNLFHPNNIDTQSKLSLSYNDSYRLQDEDVTVISERGQVACRDYPHSRHHCGKFPFNKTSHDICCPQCYCYVCDLVAPCKYWSGNSGHCHASDHDPKWKDLRAFQRGLQKET